MFQRLMYARKLVGSQQLSSYLEIIGSPKTREMENSKRKIKMVKNRTIDLEEKQSKICLCQKNSSMIYKPDSNIHYSILFESHNYLSVITGNHFTVGHLQ